LSVTANAKNICQLRPPEHGQQNTTIRVADGKQL